PAPAIGLRGNFSGAAWNESQCRNVCQPMEFICHPRRPVPPISEAEIAVAAPPDVPQAVPANPLARLLPVAMLVAAVGMMVVYFSSGAGADTGRMRSPMFMFFPVMMLVSVLGTLAYGARGANQT